MTPTWRLHATARLRGYAVSNVLTAPCLSRNIGRKSAISHSVTMLKTEDIEFQTGRAVGGSFIQVVHRPTAISRGKGPPLGNQPVHELSRELLREIEAELVERGLAQHIVPDTGS